MGLYQVRPSAIWRFVQRQPLSFWLINFYLLIEYVRPQQVWESLDILPWGRVAILGCLAAVIAESRGLALRTVAGKLLMVFTGILVLSSMVALDPAQARAGWTLYFSWVLVYLLITNTVTTERQYFVFFLAFLLYSFKMSQHGFRTWLGNGFAFQDWGATGAPGWFHNSGEFGIQMCVFLPLATEFILALRRHWNRWTRWFFYLMPFTAVASMVASSSRGALVGGAAVGLWWVLRSKHRVRTLVLTGVLAAITWVVVPPEQKARFNEAGEDETSTARLERWELGIEVANEYPLLGIGYNNWITTLGPLSHNIFIEAWTELGYAGLLSFLSMIGATFYVNHRTRRLLRGVPTATPFMRHAAHGLDGALIGYLVSGFFVTVLYYPYFWINLAMTVSLHVAAQNERRRLLARAAADAPRRAHAHPLVRRRIPGGAVVPGR